ncbi:MAG: hypothetical protein AMK70_06595 [Nitrospira bacterium SG8_35_1]|nr:MAG: hypothetical protein AMK70_06595 [Nitrospira bacterium SG8_35_1]
MICCLSPGSPIINKSVHSDFDPFAYCHSGPAYRQAGKARNLSFSFETGSGRKTLSEAKISRRKLRNDKYWATFLTTVKFIL